MSTWEQATRPLTAAQRMRLQPIEPASGVVSPPGPESDMQPSRNPLLKCPLPLIQAQPDSLRQFYVSGIPQSRIIVPSQ